jgi:pimeloyl-ACP methyl ester carboxylesterase
MERSWTEEIVHASTEDDLLLAGAAIRPVERLARTACVVLIHGNAAAFHDRPYILLGRALAARGYPVIIGNTRGHDISATLWKASDSTPFAGGGGSGWERMEDAPRDLAAWIDVASAEQSAGIVLAGHSKGAQKVVLYGMERPDPRVIGITLASPDLHGLRVPGEIEAARALVAEGRGMEVLPAQPWAPWYRQSAGTVVSHAELVDRLFSASERMPGIAALKMPLLTFFGSREPHGPAELDAIRGMASASPRVETRLIDGAHHFYSGQEGDVARVIAEWIEGLMT